jgi:glyceraldehyde 3-phosphate dehydrogenase
VKTVVLGINDNILEASDDIVSNASCTTNCASPMVKVIDDAYGIESGFLTTVHAYTGDQRLTDSPHSDLRRARAAAENIVPTSTGAANAIGKIFPHLEGKLLGYALRVPTPTGSLTELTLNLKKAPKDAAEINAKFKDADANALKGILQYTDDPIVSIDIIGSPFSCIFDSGLTKVAGNTIQIVGWYDNEYGYSARMADLMVKMASYSDVAV